MKTQTLVATVAVIIVIGTIVGVTYYYAASPTPTPTPTPTPPLPTPIPGIQLYVQNLTVWTNGTVSFKVTLYEYESGVLKAVSVNNTRYSWSDGSSESADMLKGETRNWSMDVGSFNEGDIVHVVVEATPEWGSDQAIAQSSSPSWEMKVTPRPTIPMTITEGAISSIVGQRCIFLVVVEDEEQGQAVKISATALGANVTVYPQAIIPGQVGEITVIPDKASVGKNLTVTVNGERDGLKQTKTFTVEVLEGEDDLAQKATEMRDKFIPWLATKYPELGISNETKWTGTIVNPRILVVMHYIFLSEDWEIYVTWHVTIQPHDWTRIYLRHRFTESRPSYAFEISSVEAQGEPHAIEVPEWV